MTTASKSHLPLERFSLVRSSQVSDVREQMGRCLSPHDLHVTGDPCTLDVKLNRVNMGDLSIHTLDYGAEVTIDPGERGDFYMLQLPLRGQAQLRCGSRQVAVHPGVLGVLHPKVPTWMSWSADCAMILLCASRRTIEQRLGETKKRHHVNLKLAASRHDPAVAAWWQVTQDLVRNLDAYSDIWLKHALANTSMQEFLLSAFTQMVCPTDGDAEDYKVELGRDHASLRRAKSYIVENLDQPLRLQDIANHAYVSVRTLELLFKRLESSTPLAYIRQQRLHAVHRALAKGDGRKVTEVALDYGFTHMSRFASWYRSEFGCSPSETARSTRS